MTTRHVTISSEQPTDNDHCSSHNTLKITVSTQDNRKTKSNHARQDQVNRTSTIKSKNDNVHQIKELSSKHVESLKNSLNKIIQEHFLSKVDHQQYLSTYDQLQKFILDKRPDAQIVLYGSTLFECALKQTSMIDIDVRFHDTLPYDTLKELFDIVRHSDLCKEAHMNVDDEVLSIDITMSNSNLLVRLTSNNISAIQLSRLIQIYTKFDKRVLPLLRLFRIFSKICHLDQREQGTLHPIVLHLMVIYFLQQLDPPVVPCLHEYVFGVDKAPVTLINEQYDEFFRNCNEYINRWKSTNVTSVSMLFLQLLSYFTRRFHLKRLALSIKTRMPLLKNTKKAPHHRSLFCVDPISINRNLAYSLKTGCLINYFYHTIESALNYFCETPKSENQNENLYYTITDYDENALRKQLVETIHKSYKLFIEHFSNRNKFWNNVKQEDLREQYKKTFDPVKNSIPQPILKLKENTNTQLLVDQDDIDDNEDEDEDEDDDDDEENETTDEQIAPNQKEEIVVEKEAVLFNTLAEHLDEKQKLILRKQYDEQVQLFNDKMQKILNEIKSIKSQTDSVVPVTPTEIDTSDIILTELFYDMQPKHFGADQKLPNVCSICFRTNHTKSNCPELVLPRLIHIPKANKQWTDLITRVCQQITDECKPRKQDTDIREEIVEYLKKDFGKHYPTCSVHIYGSSQNGFALRQSDLDICIQLTDNNDESNTVIFEKLLASLQLKTDIFKDTEFVRDARVPILRSKHSQFDIEIDISLNNILAVENTRLLKTYTQIDSRVSQLGYMIKYLVKTCDIGDVRTGTLSSYAYILMLIHFLQRIRPSVLPVLQQLNNDPTKNKHMIHEWNVYFYDDLTNLKQVWINNTGSNTLTTGELWIEFLRYYTEYFDYKNNIVTIRQIEPLKRDEKGWFHPTIAIEDPFILTHNLAEKLSLKKWSLIRRVFIQAREGFALQPKDIDIQRVHNDWIRDYLFDVEFLCPQKSNEFHKFNRKSKNKPKKRDNVELPSKPVKIYHNREFKQKTSTTS